MHFRRLTSQSLFLPQYCSEDDFLMYNHILTTVLLIFVFAGAASPAAGSPCVNRRPHCEENGEGVIVAPTNETVTVGQGFVFTAAANCQMILYIDDCEAPTGTVRNFDNGTVHFLTYNQSSVNDSDSGKSFVVYLLCSGTCSVPVFLTVVGFPSTPVVSAVPTCTGLYVSGQWPNNTASIRVSMRLQSNDTLVQYIYALPESINLTGVTPIVIVTFTAIGINPTDESDSHQLILNYDNYTDYSIGKYHVEIIGDTPVVFAHIKVNSTCPNSVPNSLKVSSSCVPGGYQYLDNLSYNGLVSLNLFPGEVDCRFFFSAGEKNATFDINVAPVQKVIIRNTSTTGYFTVTCMLLRGATGCAVELVHGDNVLFNLTFFRGNSTDNTVTGRSRHILPNGTYSIFVFPIKSDGTFDNADKGTPYLLTVTIPTDSMDGSGGDSNGGDSGNDNGNGSNKPKLHFIIGIPVSVLAIAVIAVIAVIAIISPIVYRTRRPRQHNIGNNENGEERQEEIELQAIRELEREVPDIRVHEPEECQGAGRRGAEIREETSNTSFPTAASDTPLVTAPPTDSYQGEEIQATTSGGEEPSEVLPGNSEKKSLEVEDTKGTSAKVYTSPPSVVPHGGPLVYTGSQKNTLSVTDAQSATSFS